MLRTNLILLTMFAATACGADNSSVPASQQTATTVADQTRPTEAIQDQVVPDTQEMTKLDGPSDRVVIVGDTATNGFFDPSLEYGPDGTGWMTYSAVYGDRFPFGPHVETRLATSNDGGATWTYVATLNPSVDDSIESGDGSILDGNWNYEVSSLLYDGDDPGREWKLFAHRTFGCPLCEELTQPQFSWITYRYTSKAEGPGGQWSDERALLGSSRLPLAPFDNLVETRIDELHPDLGSLNMVSEPGTIVVDGTLYMSLTALTNQPIAIILLASDDHAETWRYVDTLVDGDDVAPLGFETVDGSSLVELGSRPFLFFAPKLNDEYNGTFIVEIIDIEAAAVLRDAQATLAPSFYMAPDPAMWANGARNAGESDYDEGNVAGGVVFPQIDAGQLPELFGFSNSGFHPSYAD